LGRQHEKSQQVEKQLDKNDIATTNCRVANSNLLIVHNMS